MNYAESRNDEEAIIVNDWTFLPVYFWKFRFFIAIDGLLRISNLFSSCHFVAIHGNFIPIFTLCKVIFNFVLKAFQLNDLLFHTVRSGLATLI